MRERRRGAAPRRFYCFRVVAEDEVETFCLGPLRGLRDLLRLEQDQDLCCFFLFFSCLSLRVFLRLRDSVTPSSKT